MKEFKEYLEAVSKKKSNKIGFLSLKWGTIKEFEPASKKEEQLFEKYIKQGSSMSAMLQVDSPIQKKIILQLIDLNNNPNGIYLDWEGKYVSKAKAKKYITTYKKGTT